VPELPEVEVVRRGLAEHVVGRTITEVRVLHPRAARRHLLGGADLEGRLRGARVDGARRRGKFLWLPLIHAGAGGSTGDSAAAEPDSAVVVHLGMSGQMLVAAPSAGPLGSGALGSGALESGTVGPGTGDRHLRIRAELDDGSVLRFVDQRTFGGWAVDDLIIGRFGDVVPGSVAHIARDPLEPDFDPDPVVRLLKSKNTEIKRLLLDQTVVSGIGNIYADEALWRAQIHGRRPASALTKPALARLLGHAADVMRDALDQGGTSFDALYVNINGQSGYFERSLNAYGRDGRPCSRCGTTMVRESFMNRGSHFCPRCQRTPRLR
jgi:formamidopyrimidine-DNA glycosylase